MSSFNMTAIVWDELDTTELKEPETYHNFTEDPLLISCTLYRMIKESAENKKYMYANWSLTEHMDKIAAKITNEDRIFAGVIKSYYRSKLLVAKLRNEHFTNYRNDLVQFLEEAPLKVSTKFIGMIYKLPYFYAYDMKITEIFGGEYASVDGSLQRRDSVTIDFIDTVHTGRKRSTAFEYWFKDSSDNRIVVEVEKHNPVRNLWDSVVREKPITISGKFEKKRKDTLEYYVATGWSINV